MALSSLNSRSTPHQAIKQRPSEHETAQSRHHVLGPEASPHALEVALWLARGQQGDGQLADQHGAQKVEEEAAGGLQAQDAGGDAEEGGGEGADLGEDLGGEEWVR